MSYFLDTNICIYFLKGKFPSLRNKILSENPDNICIPSIVKAELLFGAEKSQRVEENYSRVIQFLFPLRMIGFNNNESLEYAKIRADLERRGELIGPNDLIIAAIVKANNGVLVTNNVKEFARVKGLKMENWTQ